MRALWLFSLALTAACGAAVSDRTGGPIDSSALTLPQPGCAAALAGGAQLEFQDDVCRRKRWPSDRDRTFRCATLASAIPAGFAPSRALAAIEIDTQMLGDLPTSLDVTVIRVLRAADGAPFYRYYSNGTQDHAFQPYSATKFLAIANAATWLRQRSDDLVGLPARVGSLPLGDLVTIVHNYNSQHYASNALGGFFQAVGGPLRANALIHDWLGRSADESFGGRYGAASPPLGADFVMEDGTSVHADDHDAAIVDNNLSTLTMAEVLRRLVMHREEPDTRLAHFLWEDARTLFYGAETPNYAQLPSASGVVPPPDGGGMSADAAIYLQAAVDLTAVEARAQGRWRIFGKMGYGGSGFVANGYACFPELDGDGAPIADRGLELVISTHLPFSGSAAHTDALVAAYYKEIVARLSR